MKRINFIIKILAAYFVRLNFNKSWLGININNFIAENHGLEKVNQDKEIDIKLLNYIKNHDKVINRVEKFLDSDLYYL